MLCNRCLPFFAFAKRWQKKRATYRETRCATYFSNKNLFRKGGLKKNASTPKIKQGCGSANDAVGQLAAHPNSTEDPPRHSRVREHQKPRYTPHVSSASSASKNAALGTIVPSVPCVPALLGTQKMYSFGFIASFAFVLRPPISAATKASG